MVVSACEAHGDAWLIKSSRNIIDMVAPIKCSMAKCGKYNEGMNIGEEGEVNKKKRCGLVLGVLT